MTYWQQVEQKVINSVVDIWPGNSSARGGYIHAAQIVCRIADKYNDPADAWKALNEIAHALEKGERQEPIQWKQ